MIWKKLTWVSWLHLFFQIDVSYNDDLYFNIGNIIQSWLVSNLVWVSCSGCERTERPWLHHGIYQTGLFVMQLAAGSARYGVNTELRLCLLLRLPLPLLRLSKIFRSGSEREMSPCCAGWWCTMLETQSYKIFLIQNKPLSENKRFNFFLTAKLLFCTR